MADEAANECVEGAETVLSPAGADCTPVREIRAFYVEGKRHCDGSGWTPCSSGVCTKQPACDYSEDLPPDIPPGTTRCRDSPGFLPSRSRRRLAHGLPSDAHEGVEDAREPGEDHKQEAREASLALADLPLPLKRSRLSVSPATGLIGLPENGFLHDFFGCLGFIGIASEWVVRDAMISVMLATTPSCKSLVSWRLPPEGAEEETDVGDSNCQVEGRWSKAVTAGGAVLPRTTSTCLMWCAIALGALVRGIPLTHIEWYVDLAEDSLDACSGSATLDLARAHIAMAFLQSFLGDQAKNEGSLQRARGVLSSFPTEQVPERLRDLAQYAGESWDFERPTIVEGVALDGYWSDDAPIEKLPDVFAEENVLRYMLGVDRGNTSLYSATRVSIAKVYGPSSSSKVERSGEKLGDASAAKPAAGALRQDVLPELMRLQKYVERSEMRYGIGALHFYGILYMAQVMSEDHAGAVESFWRSLDVKLRYPGLCRINCWLHPAHTHLWSLASGPHRERYEELRAVYNMVRPEGSKAAPPYEDWTGISDVCDHTGVFCRGMMSPVNLRLRPAVEEGAEAPGLSA